MRVKLSIPKNIKVGFQKRQDTYTGKLAYVISGLRKEDPKSWVNWRDKAINPETFDNEPTNGFVLNRDVGGTQRSYDWNARREKVRVYDPRDFEFEITVENVLLILQECSSIKGKGLEGEFVYAWSGQQLVLLPVCSQEYKRAVEFMELGEKSVSAKDVIPGCTYLTKDKEEWMYVGRFNWHEYAYYSDLNDNGQYYRSGYGITKGRKQYVFVNLKSKVNKGRDRYVLQANFSKLAYKTSDRPIPTFADEFEKLNKTYYVSNPVEIVLKDSEFNFNKTDRWYVSPKICVKWDGKYYLGNVRRTDYTYPNGSNKTHEFFIECQHVAEIDKNGYKEIWVNKWEKRGLNEETTKAIVKRLCVKFENGAEYEIK